jgi:hypothetical protein
MGSYAEARKYIMRRVHPTYSHRVAGDLTTFPGRELVETGKSDLRLVAKPKDNKPPGVIGLGY